ncbi:MAG: hypothetical protein M3Y81_13950 [Chloroflexota bacterium]|nr:hypothetical protein [Chloroflexota bacterium]
MKALPASFYALSQNILLKGRKRMLNKLKIHLALRHPWWRTRQEHNPLIRKHLLQVTPAPFARRNIFCSNRLFQNKYEMYEWIQEAIDKGITNPGAIHRYAHQKEISIHRT